MSGRRTLVVAVVAGLLCVLATGWWALRLEPERDEPAAQAPTASPSPTPATVAEAIELVPKPKPKPRCATAYEQPFVPTRISVAGITAGAAVLALPRDRNNAPGVTPLTSAGKEQFAFDLPMAQAGEPQGNVIVNAHAWPDGSALGDRLKRKLGVGELLELRGPGGEQLCYRVTDRLEVPANDAPLDRVFDSAGPPQLVVITCSGTRLGPGRWSHSTLWFASPVV